MNHVKNIGKRIFCVSNLKWKSTSVLSKMEPIVWIDCELTGLDLEKDKLMEIACVVTDSNLNIIKKGIDVVIHQPAQVLDDMNSVCMEMHAKSNLTSTSLASTIDVGTAEQMVLDFLRPIVREKQSPLAGNSVYMDRLFLMKWMPRLNDYLHYRIIDVSTVKLLCNNFNPDIYALAPPKKYNHRALEDIYSSIEELQYYQRVFLNCKRPASSTDVHIDLQ